MTAEELAADIRYMDQCLDSCPKVTAQSADAELRLERALLAARWMIGILWQLLAENERRSVNLSDLMTYPLGRPPERRYALHDFTESRKQIKARIASIDAELVRRAQQQAAHERSLR